MILEMQIWFQIKALPIGLDNIHVPSEEEQKRIYETAMVGGGGDAQGEGKRKWRRGEMEFEALMRFLDNAVSRKLAFFY